ncbi:hypothetical protein GCM10009564_06370 [Streptomyces thermogriseus]|uniref:Uncharacterized protein n=1 Tax=Streptomyces thermogriseus TaxID=75292 RepID=A0ABN1STS5_9ACTN
MPEEREQAVEAHEGADPRNSGAEDLRAAITVFPLRRVVHARRVLEPQLLVGRGAVGARGQGAFPVTNKIVVIFSRQMGDVSLGALRAHLIKGGRVRQWAMERTSVPG